MVKIIPAILTDDINDLKEKVNRAEGIVDRVQIDIVDGIFAKNKTIDPSAIENLDLDLNLDFHLMVKEPIHWVEKVARVGVDRIIGQIEMMEDQLEFVGKVQEVGLHVGLAIDLATPVSEIDPTLLTNLDVVLVMSVPAGFGGQKFDPKALSKVSQLNKIKSDDKTPFSICVDGGETLETINETHFAGADEIVIGRMIFNGDLAENIKKFQSAAEKLDIRN